MKDLIKSIFNLNTILDCYISAIGYGLGYSIPDRLGCSMVVCIISCFAFGFLFDWIADKILNSKPFKGKDNRKIMFAILIYIFYVMCWSIGDYFFGYDLDYEFLSDVKYTIIAQILAFVVKFFVEKYKREKAKKN